MENLINVENRAAYSVEEVSKMTTLSKPFLRGEIRAGRLTVKRFGRRVLVLTADLQNYLDQKNNGESSSQN